MELENLGVQWGIQNHEVEPGMLEEQIMAFEGCVQFWDIVAFNKISRHHGSWLLKM